jgi:hypothetical protein
MSTNSFDSILNHITGRSLFEIINVLEHEEERYLIMRNSSSSSDDKLNGYIHDVQQVKIFFKQGVRGHLTEYQLSKLCPHAKILIDTGEYENSQVKYRLQGICQNCR